MNALIEAGSGSLHSLSGIWDWHGGKLYFPGASHFLTDFFTCAVLHSKCSEPRILQVFFEGSTAASDEAVRGDQGSMVGG